MRRMNCGCRREDPCLGLGAGPDNLMSFLWEEALLGREAQGGGPQLRRFR